jgi:hypothetical protein
MSNIPGALFTVRVNCRGPLRLSLLGLFLWTSACAPSVPAQSQAPRKEAKREQRTRSEPLHVAPPPDYGNKIVLCDRESDERKL